MIAQNHNPENAPKVQILFLLKLENVMLGGTEQKSRAQKIAEARRVGLPASGGGAALEQARPKAELTKGSSTFFVNRQPFDSSS